MIHTINFEKRALEELNDAIEWYEKQQEGLGKILRDDIIRQVTEIDKDPTNLEIPIKNLESQTHQNFLTKSSIYSFQEKKSLL